MSLWKTQCFVCGRVLGHHDGKLVCDEELTKVKGVASWEKRCTHCDQRLQLSSQEGLCYDCFWRFSLGEVALDKSFALFYYEGVVKYLYQQFKFEGKKTALDDLCTLTENRKSEWVSRLPEVEVIIPLPSSWMTNWKRGFSPVSMFWRRFFPQLQEDILARKGGRTPQKVLDRDARRQYIQQQFWVRYPEKIRGKRVLVVDDIYTTGSTLEEVARIMKHYGAREVFALVICRDGFAL
ncbi:MAG: phosphoribosyltransferase family protein [Brevinematales bacterium]|nr:phosphoribosyltransferase family protein [Brevinematales bacterium]